jgi:hypothetical protein
MTASVVTRSYDFYRTGANDEEATLSASAVRVRGIAKLFSMSIPDDPRLEAQPLAVGNVPLSNGETNVPYGYTEEKDLSRSDRGHYLRRGLARCCCDDGGCAVNSED